jgi:hypothetical protein
LSGNESRKLQRQANALVSGEFDNLIELALKFRVPIFQSFQSEGLRFELPLQLIVLPGNRFDGALSGPSVPLEGGVRVFQLLDFSPAFTQNTSLRVLFLDRSLMFDARLREFFAGGVSIFEGLRDLSLQVFRRSVRRILPVCPHHLPDDVRNHEKEHEKENPRVHVRLLD